MDAFTTIMNLIRWARTHRIVRAPEKEQREWTHRVLHLHDAEHIRMLQAQYDNPDVDDLFRPGLTLAMQLIQGREGH